MQLGEIVGYGSGGILILMTLLQIAPIKVNPWTALAKWAGKAINGEVIERLDKVEKNLSKHIQVDDERDADHHRANILRFNTELLRNKKHTREDFIEILYNIDCYERYCREHPDYQNNRAVHAIANIGRVYDNCMRKRDFLDPYDGEKKSEDEKCENS